MKCYVITLFPEMFDAIKDYGITKRAIDKKLLELFLVNPRDFTNDSRRTVDDASFGGGPGMVMKVEPLVAAIEYAKASAPKAKVIYLSPQGKTLKQKNMQALSMQNDVIFVAGRYEGIDERVISLLIDEQWSIGDYVLTGGELAVMTVIDAAVRLIPGVLGDESSSKFDSFSDGLLDFPHYTRPSEFRGNKVPDVLLSGNHSEIARWRLKMQLGKTWQLRKDLIDNIELSDIQEELLEEFKAEYKDLKILEEQNYD